MRLSAHKAGKYSTAVEMLPLLTFRYNHFLDAPHKKGPLDGQGALLSSAEKQKGKTLFRFPLKEEAGVECQNGAADQVEHKTGLDHVALADMPRTVDQRIGRSGHRHHEGQGSTNADDENQ